MLLPTCVSHLPPVLPALNTEGNIQAYSTLTVIGCLLWESRSIYYQLTTSHPIPHITMEATGKKMIKIQTITATYKIINQRNKAEAAFQQHKQKLYSLMSDPRLGPVIRPLYDAIVQHSALVAQADPDGDQLHHPRMETTYGHQHVDPGSISYDPRDWPGPRDRDGPRDQNGPRDQDGPGDRDGPRDQSGLTVQPGPTVQPGLTVQPGPTVQPGVTVQPGPTVQPGVTVQPGTTVQPGVTVQHDPYINVTLQYPAQNNLDCHTVQTCITKVAVCHICYRDLSENTSYLVDPEQIRASEKTNPQSNLDPQSTSDLQSNLDPQSTSDSQSYSLTCNLEPQVTYEPINITLPDKKTKSKSTFSFTFSEEEKAPTGIAYYFQVVETTIQESGQAETKQHRKELSKEEFYTIKGKLSNPNRRHLRRKARVYANFIAGLPIIGHPALV